MRSVPFPPLPPLFPNPSVRPPIPAWLNAPSNLTDSLDLRSGCWLLNWYEPRAEGTGPLFQGSLRLERQAGRLRASGDLYRVAEQGPRLPAAEVPVFAIDDYLRYLRITQMQASPSGDEMRFSWQPFRFSEGSDPWRREPSLHAVLAQVPASPRYPRAHVLAGSVMDEDGEAVAWITLGWVSAALRRAVLEMDAVVNVPLPQRNRAGQTWKDFFDAVDWDLQVVTGDDAVPDQAGGMWSDGQLHDAMLCARNRHTDLDQEWRYHLFCVPRLRSTSRGIMFDARGTDANGVPREGAAIAANWPIPKEPKWGTVAGLSFGKAEDPYLRTAVHEIGHAMGLHHNHSDLGFMNTTGVIAEAALPGTFPANVQWDFNRLDADHLRHEPDIVVRPGGMGFFQIHRNGLLTDRGRNHPDLVLSAEPLRDVVPLGAPVRIGLTLTNKGDSAVVIPNRLGLAGGCLFGSVTGPNGGRHEFSSLKTHLGDGTCVELAPGKATTHWLTLWRGGGGALFPGPGLYQVALVLAGEGEPGFTKTADCTLLVTDARDDDHALAAKTLLSEPETLPLMVFGGTRYAAGLKAIRKALDIPALFSHWAYIAARLLVDQGVDEAAARKQVVTLLKQAIMSPTEKKKSESFT